jgi:hypothetical protein
MILLACTAVSVVWYLVTLQRIAPHRKGHEGRAGAADNLGNNWFALLNRDIYTEQGQRLYPQFVVSALLSMGLLITTVFTAF